MTREELMKLSKDQLVKWCRNQGLDSSGDKAALVDRLAVSETAEPEVPAPEPPAVSEIGEPEPEPEPAEPKPEE